MKKLSLILLITLFFSSNIFSQYIEIRRGDDVSKAFSVRGNFVSDTLVFVVKYDTSFTSPRLIQKKNEVVGETGIKAVYNAETRKTNIVVFIKNEDTDDLYPRSYVYDLKAYGNQTKTLAIGTFYLSPSVQTPFDGTNLAGSGIRVTTVSLANGSLQNEYIKWDTTLNAWIPSGTVPGTGSGSDFDSTYIYQQLSTKATLSATQTFTGINTFSGNKTVFGTTTNDSVGVRGRLNVDYNSVFKSNLDITKRLRVGDYSITTNPYLNFTPASSSFFLNNLFMMLIPPLNTWTYSNKQVFSAADYTLMARNNIFYSFNGFVTDGIIKMSGDIFENPDTSKLGTLTGINDTLQIVGTVLLNGNPLSPSGSVTDADSLGGIPASAYVTKSGIDGWSTNLYSGSANVMRLGKSYNDKRFNNGAYSDVWNIDYVIPPYNLSADWLYSIEHRTDYFNDTLNTVAHSDIVNVDGTGTTIWKTNDVRIMGNEIAVNVGDLPDSVTLNWSLAGLTGNKVILSEANKTAIESRFPMPVRGFEFKFGSTPNYIFPRVYSFFSDLTTNTPSLETAYHFYGQGNYPSYFGGNIYTDGYLRVQDSIIIGTSTVKIYPDSITIGGTRVPKITEITTFDSTSLSNRIDAIPIVSISYPNANTIEIATGESIILDPSTLEISGGNLTVVGGTGGLDTSVVNALIEANEDSSGQSIIGTTATLDSIITDYWNDALGGSTIDTAIVNALIEANEDTTGSAIIGTTETLDSLITDYWNDNLGGGSTWDSTYAYQRITALESTVNSLQNSINNILAALDTCGCSASTADNTPTAPPTSLVAHGGEYETQMRITWTDPTASDFDSIRIYRNTANDSTGAVWIASVAENIETYTNTGRTANTTYWYWAKALDDSSNLSYFSNSDSGKTLATATADTGFYMLDAEDGVGMLTITGGGVTASTDISYAGTHSYKIAGLGGTTRTYADFDFPVANQNQDTIWVTYRIYIPTGTAVADGGWNYASLLIGGGDANGDNGEFGLNSSTNIDGWQKPFGTLVSTNFSTNAWHKIEIMYIQGTGANARDHVYVDEDLIYSTNTGAGTVDTDGFRFGAYNWTMATSEAIYFDNIIFSTARLPLD